LEETP